MSLDAYPTPQYWHLVMATKTGTVGEQVVLECFLILFYVSIYSCSSFQKEDIFI